MHSWSIFESEGPCKLMIRPFRILNCTMPDAVTEFFSARAFFSEESWQDLLLFYQLEALSFLHHFTST